MGKNGKNEEGKRIKEDIGRKVGEYGGIGGISRIGGYRIMLEEDVGRRYLGIKGKK